MNNILPDIDGARSLGSSNLRFKDIYLTSPIMKYNEYLELYVSTTGNDNNDGTTSSTPVQSVNKALQIAKQYVYNTCNINIQSGTYDNIMIVNARDISLSRSSGTVQFTVTNCLNSRNITFQNITLVSLGIEDSDIKFNGCSYNITLNQHLAGFRSNIRFLGTQTITNNNSAYFLDIENCNVFAQSLDFTFTNTSSYSSAFLGIRQNSNCTFKNVTFTGTFNGTSAKVDATSTLYVGRSLVNYFPSLIVPVFDTNISYETGLFDTTPYPYVTEDEHWTGRYFKDKKIYHKLYNIGALPSSSSKNIALNITNFDKVIHFYGYAKAPGISPVSIIPLPWTNASSNVLIHVGIPNLIVASSGSYTSYTESYAVLEYLCTDR